MNPFVKTAMILDIRRAKNDGKFPVKLRVTYERKQKYFKTQFNLSTKDFDKIMFGKRISEIEKNIRNQILAHENKAIEIINSLPIFTWQVFEKYFYSNRASKNLIRDALLNYSKELRGEGRIGTAVSYECAERSLNKFLEGAKFSDITIDVLKNYEQWMLAKGNSITTVGIYLRCLRTIFNNAISEGIFNKEFYPFGKKKYEIPKGKNIKKSLTLSEIELIYKYKPAKGTTSEKARDMWIFMYLCNGINVKDLALLKFENLKDDVIEFDRAKTSKTKRVTEAIRIIISEDVLEIIDKWGNKKKEPKNYIFPILNEGISPVRERQLIQQFTQLVNKHMKIIAKELNINKKTTTYVSRHSFATILKRHGVSTEYISEALGHSDLKTTQSYLAGFEDESKRKNLKALTNFKK